MTENEAKTKWCPWAGIMMTIVSTRFPLSATKEISKTLSEGNKCMASYCMVWRWIIYPTDCTGRPVPESSGYCGMGGKP
jgi:hypothetical protein